MLRARRVALDNIILCNINKLINRFGNAVLLLAGDFRQTLPVIPRSTPACELNACLKSSILWKYLKTLKLSVNMRVEQQNDQSGETFSKQLLDIG